MQRLSHALPDIFLLEPRVFRDERGFFLETFNQRTFEELGITTHFVQDNHSRSVRGTLRGFHYQRHFPQAKLCRVVVGEILDVVVDIRVGSPTFGKWDGAVLSADNCHQIYIPRGFAHGFLVLSEVADFLYKCDGFYHPGDEYGVTWNDPELNINWNWEQLGIEAPLLSDKDKLLPCLRDIPRDQLPSY